LDKSYLDESLIKTKKITSFILFVHFFFVQGIFLSSTGHLNEVSHLQNLPISLISCHDPWFSPASWDLLKRITFMRTFPYLQVSSASRAELPSRTLKWTTLIVTRRN
jgi:hypothetical protein